MADTSDYHPSKMDQNSLEYKIYLELLEEDATLDYDNPIDQIYMNLRIMGYTKSESEAALINVGHSEPIHVHIDHIEALRQSIAVNKGEAEGSKAKGCDSRAVGSSHCRVITQSSSSLPVAPSSSSPPVALGSPPADGFVIVQAYPSQSVVGGGGEARSNCSPNMDCGGASTSAIFCAGSRSGGKLKRRRCYACRKHGHLFRECPYRKMK